MARSRIEAFAPAKVNLFLHIGDKRADGYHELESVAVFVDVGDKLVFEQADVLSLAVEGPFAAGLSGESDNLVLKAARALAEDSDHRGGARITLTKNLPVASGIGGGSADAAAALRGLVQLWELDVGPYHAKRIAETLGSDVPVCVESRNAWMDGRGEIVTWTSGIHPFSVVLANPGVAVPTAQVFGALRARTGIGQVSRWEFDPHPASMADFVRNTRNDLEPPALALAPEIGTVLDALRSRKGALAARMSGSGATCFAIFEDRETAEDAAAALAGEHPGWWVKAARVIA